MHWGRLLAVFHTLGLLPTFAAIQLARIITDDDSNVLEGVIQMLLFLGSYSYVPMLLSANAEGNRMHSYILGFARVSLLSQGFGVGMVLASSSYHIAINVEKNLDVLEILTLVVGTCLMINLASLFYGGWVSVDSAPRFVARNEKSQLSLIAIGVTIFGAIMSNFAFSWYTALLSLRPGSDLILLTMGMFGLIFEYVSLALGPALFLSMKWKLGSFHGRRDIIVMFVSLLFVVVSQIMLIVVQSNAQAYNIGQIAIIEVFLILSGLAIISACILTLISAAYVLKSHKMGLFGFVPQDDQTDVEGE